MRAVGPRLFHRDAQILAHQVHRKTEIEFAVDHGLAAVFHLPRRRCTLGNHVNHELGIQSGMQRKRQALGQPLHHAGDADLIDHLGFLAGARRPHQCHRTREMRDHRLGTRVRFGITADHHRQNALLRTGLAAGDWRIEKMQVLRARCGMQFLRHRRRRRGVIDKNRVTLHAVESAVFADRHFAHIIIIADTAEHDVCRRGRSGRRIRNRAGVLRRPGLHFVAGAVIDGHRMSGVRQMPRHGPAHDAESDECNFHIGCSLQC